MSRKSEAELDTEGREVTEEAVKELERLMACYQVASYDDRLAVWAILNKYAPMIEDI